MQTYRPQNLNTHVKIDVESDVLHKKRQLLRLDRVPLGKSTYEKVLFLLDSWGYYRHGVSEF